MQIVRNGSQPSRKGPADWFTGVVRGRPAGPARRRRRGSTAASVTFEPGARTAWHTHPLGQTPVVTAGCGRAQRRGGPVEEIRPGDVVWFAAGREALARRGPTTAMTHIAIQEQVDGKAADWMEQVSRRATTLAENQEHPDMSERHRRQGRRHHRRARAASARPPPACSSGRRRQRRPRRPPHRAHRGAGAGAGRRRRQGAGDGDRRRRPRAR